MTNNKIDTQNMRQVIEDSPSQLAAGLELAKQVKIKGSFEKVIVCGLGGSALSADITKALHVPVEIHRDYNLPKTANEKSLMVCISYSGNTEETVSALEEAISKKLTTVGMASGGKIETLCQQNNLPFVKIPSGVQPRSAVGYMFSALMTIFTQANMCNDMSSEILQTVSKLQEINPVLEQEGQVLAKKLVKKIPIVYATNSDYNDAIARIWKIKFNENSKIPAFYNYFPELNHNEMVGYEGLHMVGGAHFCTIILKDSFAHPRTLKRIDLTTDLIKKAGGSVEIIDLREGSDTFKIFASLLLGDWASYYLALEYKIDPTPVKIVEEFKKMMQD